MRLSGWCRVFLVVAGVGLSACEEKDVCADVACGDGVCVARDGRAECLCNFGFELRGGQCVSSDPCAGNPCTAVANSLCFVDAGSAHCECPPTRIEVGGSCVLPSVCVPNPCSGANQTHCIEENAAARCLCDDGFVPGAGGCSATPRWDCAVEHAGDPAEPDECPARASTLENEAMRSLSPAGDTDWFRVAVTPGEVFSFTASGSVALRIELFSLLGETLASDVRDDTNAQVFFTVPAGMTEVLLRISGPSTSQGDYVLRMLRVGTDDFPNSAANAPLHAGTFSGDLEYSQDLDVVRLQLPALTDVLLIAHPGDVIFELQRSDGGVRLLDTEAIHVTVPVAEELLVTARARDNVSTGAYQLEVTTHGPDDHATDRFFGTAAAWNSTLFGRFDRDLDIDTFVARQAPAHVYALHFDNVDRGQVAVIDAQGTVVGESSYPRGVVCWEAVSGQPADLVVSYFGENRPDGGGPNYRVDVEDLGVDDFGDTLATAAPLTLPATLTGIAAPESDIDMFSFVAPAGHIFEVNGALALTDATGQAVPGRRGSEPTLLPDAGTYFVSVSSTWWDVPLRYQLTVRDVGVDDHGDTTNPTLVQVGTPASGALQFTGDTDAFTFPTVERHVYEVRCTGTGCALSEGGPASVVVVADGSGQHTVVVSGSTVPATFSLQVTELGVEDHGSTAVTATPLTFDVRTTGEFLWSGDVDVFSFPMVAGGRYAVFVSKDAHFPSVHDVAGGSLAIFGQQSGAPRTASFVASSTGTAFVSVFGGTAYWVRASDLSVDDHGDTFATGTAATPGNVTAVVASATDADVFTLPTEQRFYTATVGTLCRVSIIDAADTVLLSGVTATVKGDGSPLGFRVTSSSAPQLCELSLQVSAVDDHGDTAATATPLTWDAGVVGSFQHATDVDVFSLPVTVGEIAVVEMTSGLMELISPTGVMIPFGHLGAVRATETGVWTVRVLNVNGNQPSPWTITARTTVDDFGDTEATATPYVLGTTQTGVLQHYDDLDYFSVTLQAGVDYGIERQAGPTLAWPYLSFFQAGVPVTPQPGVAPGTFRFPTTGTYFVRVARGQGWTPTPWSWRLF